MTFICCNRKKTATIVDLQVIIISFLVVSIITITVFIIYTYRARRKLEHDEAEMQ